MSQNQPIKNIEVGKFYFIHDGSKTGHPGFVVWKDDEKNRYLVIRFDSDKYGDIPKKERGIKHITKLSNPTNPSVMNSYVHNRPMICKRKDIGILLVDLMIDSSDIVIIERVSKQTPEKSPSLRK
ncbi:MAG: hypothetical protein K6E11_00500 [Bacilli bacterium]|nr:hypothetical protein [Bacilli bacterium]